MSAVFMLRMYAGEDFVDEVQCLGMTLEAEAYTPYVTMTAYFLSDGRDYGSISEVSLYYHYGRVFIGMLDSVKRFQKDGVEFVRVSAKSFTCVLTQNELVPGMHYDMTLEKLMTGFYQFPWILYENYEGTGYLYVKDGSSMWDSIANFCYKLNGHYPYIQGNTVRLTLDEDPRHIVLTEEQVLETGTFQDNSRLISHFHMADIEGNYDAYSLENTAATAANIVRHKQFQMDQQYLSNPQLALTFRSLYSMRGYRGKYVVYNGFDNPVLGDLVTYEAFLQNARICRVKAVYSAKGIQTTVWAYDDGFYHIES